MPRPAASLADKLSRRLRASGPMTVADYMQACLTDPDFGYYRAGDPFGAQGDFVTAPEVSQIFGELIGLWCVTVWRAMGEPAPLRLIELGPGRGTLMADALRAARLVPDFPRAARVHLVELNPALRTVQAERLTDLPVEPSWHARLDEVPAGVSLVIANEFLDALPIRQFLFQGGAWHERLVGLDDAGRFAFVLADAPVSDASILPPGLRASPADGAVAELRPGMHDLAAILGRRARAYPLAALIVDYGHARSGWGDTLQAVRAHAFADPLAEPGRADLTAHVDFAALAEAAGAQGLTVRGPLPQGQFLLALGLAQRCDRLLRHNPARAEEIAAGAARLVNADRMGELFKVMALTDPARPVPPPFAAQQFEDT